jgi:Tetracyclin repressor-like, C-terminal domain
MAGYIRGLLSDGSPAGAALFGRLYQATRAGMRQLEQARVIRASRDDAVRDAHLLCNHLAVVLLRPPAHQAGHLHRSAVPRRACPPVGRSV